MKIDLLKQQQRRQIKTAATAKVQRHGGLGKEKLKAHAWEKKINILVSGLQVYSFHPFSSGPPFFSSSGKRERRWRLCNRTPVATGGPSEARLWSGWGGLEVDTCAGGADLGCSLLWVCVCVCMCAHFSLGMLPREALPPAPTKMSLTGKTFSLLGAGAVAGVLERGEAGALCKQVNEEGELGRVGFGLWLAGRQAGWLCPVLAA